MTWSSFKHPETICFMDALTAGDYESVDRAGRILQERGWLRSYSVNEMTNSYRGLIESLEKSGYDEAVYEYINDLACRDWLALAWPILTDRVRLARQAEMDALDDRFLAVTIEDAEARLAQYCRVGTDPGWWWLRIPKTRTGQFKLDLG